MQLGGRMAAAIEVLTDIETRHTSAAMALHDWGRAHRFAGSGDRAAIGNLVYDVLRGKAGLAQLMGGDAPRGLVLAVLVFGWGLVVDEVASAAAHKFGPGALTAGEEEKLRGASALEPHPNVPDWLIPSFKAAFGSDWERQGAALSERAPIDLRVNSLKATREQVLEALAGFGAEPGPLSDLAVRIPATVGAKRAPNVEIEAAHGRGWFEVQDAGSQVAAALSGVKPGDTVLDLCAGAGGKTLSMAAQMQNEGRLFAHDRDKRRLRPIYERLTRAGVTNVEVIGPDDKAALSALDGQMDIVFVDAPCTGTGTWRRKPDAKWRLREKTLAQRLVDQQTVLATAAKKVRPGGRIVYVTCSVLPEENTEQVARFCADTPSIKIVPVGELWENTSNLPCPVSANNHADKLLLTPADQSTDGFFVAVLELTAT